ncbi:hypothetical protein L873DRAFT_44005 [Choiromyces venosus 120613-1]|uniref:Uncharacterized protein n=1 Tax=Choiromyces venosus 120613-1 TaxID=1336337 RepID=A0A3N4K029_9PEZI|nr:hypothetical protein L873DRAFT_44005 [Choiromyces venosus 120613-1]
MWKIRKVFGVFKRQIINEIALRILTKPVAKIGYKYNNLLKSYGEAVKLNGQSGWELTEQDIDEGRREL